MCGIHGFINGMTKQTTADDFIRQAFIANSLRGTDASGIASIKAGTRDSVYQKLPVPGYMFGTDAYARTLITAANDAEMMTLCHTRSTTTGSKGGIAEAHPFMVYDTGRELVGVHNGTLTNWYDKKGGKDFKVDSEWALNHIFNNGMDAFKDFIGSYCLVWWDSDNDRVLNFALNDQRPMNIAFTKDGGMGFASEAGMLYWLMDRTRLGIKDGKVLSLEAGHHYKFEVGKLGEYSKVKLPAVVRPATSTHNPTHSSSRGTYGSPTMVEQTELLLANILKDARETPDGASLPTEAKTTLATAVEQGIVKSVSRFLRKKEIDTARDLSLMNMAGLFEPIQVDGEGEISGIFYAKDTEFGAVIRNAGQYVWAKDTLWECRVIGAVDDGRETLLICGHPINNTTTTKRANVSTAIETSTASNMA